MHVSLSVLLCSVLLTACGGTEAELAAPEEESLGTVESPLCAGQYVTQLGISTASVSSSYVLEATGSWTVSSGANAVRLEYYVNGTLSTTEERVGASGNWTFSASGAACGIPHDLVVKAWPMIIDSAGNRTTCSAALAQTSQTVSSDCHWAFAGGYFCGIYPQPACPGYPLCPTTNPSGQVCSPLGSMCKNRNSGSIVFYYCR
jgi:hypothetical protein